MAETTSADQFTFGKDEGCDFLSGQCSVLENFHEFCSNNASIYRCTHDYHGTATCRSNTFTDGCHISMEHSNYSLCTEFADQ